MSFDDNRFEAGFSEELKSHFSQSIVVGDAIGALWFPGKVGVIGQHGRTIEGEEPIQPSQSSLAAAVRIRSYVLMNRPC